MYAKQALSIGINAYVPSYLALQPCINDATDLSNSLRSIGFHVKLVADTDLNSTKAVIHRFINSIQPGSIAVFYFSGHGVQHDGHNYLIPTNALGICADNIKSTAIDAQKTIDAMHERHPRLVICILDCCRTEPPTEPIDGSSPYKRTFAGTKAGFARMHAEPSTIIVYACAPNETASPESKNGRNSLYTYHLLRYIRAPNIDIDTILRYVAADVKKDSKNAQIPFRSSNCKEAIYLAANQVYKTPMLPQYIHPRPIVQPFHRRHTKSPAVHHLQPHANNFQYPLNGHFGMPINHYLLPRNPLPNMIRVPLGSGYPFVRDSRHHRR